MSNEKINTGRVVKSIFENLFLVLAGAFLFAFSNPNLLLIQGFAFAAWIMYVPYFFLIKNSSFKTSWLYSGLYGVCSIVMYAYWLYNYSPLCLVIALVIGFFGTALFGLLLKLLQRFFVKNYWLVWFLALCAFEYLRTLGFLGFHYALAAYSQWNTKLLLQSVSVVGPFGLNALVVFCSCLVFAFLSKLQDKKLLLHKMIEDNTHYEGATYINYVSENDRLLQNTSLVSPVVFSVVWLVLVITALVYGSIRLNSDSEKKSVTVAAIQHNDNPDSDGLENYRESIQSLINLTDEALEINPDIDIVIWPETAVVPSIVYHYNTQADSERKKLVTHLLNYINSRNPVFVIGNQHINVNQNGTEKKYYNSALVFQKDKNVIPPQPKLYSKIHLVPFSESFPYQKYFPHVYKLLLENVKFFWNSGDDITVFNEAGLSFYTPICFESTFPDLCRRACQKGAEALFCLANDSWSKSLACQYQHMAMAKFRAVENNVPVVISSVSGQTAVIDSDGQLLEMAVPFSKTYVISHLPVEKNGHKTTIYNKSGDIFGYGMLFFFIAVLLIRIFVGIIQYIQKRK